MRLGWQPRAQKRVGCGLHMPSQGSLLARVPVSTGEALGPKREAPWVPDTLEWKVLVQKEDVKELFDFFDISYIWKIIYFGHIPSNKMCY